MEGDRHANVNGLRQILLMEKEILDGLSLTPGTIRENVTITGLAIHGLAAGERVRLGSDVVLEVTGLCEPCSRMDEIREGLRETLDRRRGVLTRVVSGGEVGLGDGGGGWGVVLGEEGSARGIEGGVWGGATGRMRQDCARATGLLEGLGMTVGL